MDQALRHRRVPYATAVPYVPERDISLKELVQILWRGKWLILASALVLGGAAAGASLALPKTYRASVVVAPVTSEPGSMGGTASVLSEFSSVAALAGIPLARDDARSEAIAILNSSSLTSAYIRQNHLLPVLYPDLWDPGTKQWRVASRDDIPTLWQANRFFMSDVRQVTEDTRTGMITLTVTWTDPTLAARWANGLVSMTNEYLRGKAIEEAERKIAYLHEQAAKTSIVQVQNAIYSLLESQIKSAMLARGTKEYALRVMDAAVPPEKPSAPRPLLWTFAGLCTGLLAGALFVFARTAWRASP